MEGFRLLVPPPEEGNNHVGESATSSVACTFYPFESLPPCSPWETSSNPLLCDTCGSYQVTDSSNTFCPFCNRTGEMPPVSCVDYTTRRHYVEDPNPSISKYRRLVIAIDAALLRSELDEEQSGSLWQLVETALRGMHGSVLVALVLYDTHLRGVRLGGLDAAGASVGVDVFPAQLLRPSSSSSMYSPQHYLCCAGQLLQVLRVLREGVGGVLRSAAHPPQKQMHAASPACYPVLEQLFGFCVFLRGRGVSLASTQLL
eukprot:gene40920-49913_t